MTFINTNVPIFRHRIASKTEKHKEASRNQLDRPSSSFMYWIDVNWKQLGLRRISLDIFFIIIVRLSISAVYKVQKKCWKVSNRRFLAFYAGAQSMPTDWALIVWNTVTYTVNNLFIFPLLKKSHTSRLLIGSQLLLTLKTVIIPACAPACARFKRYKHTWLSCNL